MDEIFDSSFFSRKFSSVPYQFLVFPLPEISSSDIFVQRVFNEYYVRIFLFTVY